MTAEGSKGTLEAEVAVGLLQEHSRHPDQQECCAFTENLGRGIQKAPGSADLSSQQSYRSESLCFHGPSSINLFWISVPDVIHF